MIETNIPIPAPGKRTARLDKNHLIPVDVKMVGDFEVAGGSFNRLSHELHEAVLDEDRGVIHYTVRGRRCGMSIHSAAIAAWVYVA